MESLEELNAKEADLFIGAVVLISVLMIIGFIGNLHVLLVYTFRTKPSNHRTFILFLGVFDIITCVTAMPFSIYTLRKPLIYATATTCKSYVFINQFTCSSSALTVLVIAIERYRKICVPLGKQMSQRLAARLCLLVVMIAALLSLPSLVLVGASSSESLFPGLNVTLCDAEDKVHYDLYLSYHQIFLVIIVVALFIVLAILYILIWRATRRHLRSKGKRFNVSFRREIRFTQEMNTCETEMDTGVSENQPGTASKQSTRDIDTANTEKSDRSKRITLAFFLITVLYFVSYIPHWAIAMCTRCFDNVSDTEEVVINTVFFCVYISNMANCFVYGYFDENFRREIKTFYKHKIIDIITQREHTIVI